MSLYKKFIRCSNLAREYKRLISLNLYSLEDIKKAYTWAKAKRAEIRQNEGINYGIKLTNARSRRNKS